MAKQETERRGVLHRLAGSRCPACDGGILVRDTYKDNPAVVCDQCDVPRAQRWS